MRNVLIPIPRYKAKIATALNCGWKLMNFREHFKFNTMLMP